MIDSITRAGASSAERFERVGVPADPRMAAQTRDEFSRWLNGALDLDAYRASDLLLATYEALANTAEFAYPSTGFLGTMDVRAQYDPTQATLTVTVADHGSWRTAPSTPRDRTRGRGIALMKALSDRASIQTSTGGTTVRLVWTEIRTRFLPDRDDTPSGQ
ncbi:anti-sigma regulatory factor [Mycobacterium antarcticum]|uniref:ATP-binding protein n=1 Tax=unclassified Mycolicibacterium TaxID=2636767 RepID=UPI002397905D|nr:MULTISPECIES: ATP-binding protein [unclassified Mycolicibacterium]BDX32016.1 anti-sigma regulatory factor [Mycolicibacterium sp. TUM20985]GLP75320.1 anti-sigma regulatory factor [Mycolicibacterium sp. TUM20983]GLP84416.1 anti-sigma regulatory factor [Mycolicibacterium sp. TUM20984]